MMFQPSPGTNDHHQRIQISGEDLATVKEFKYLGSTATYNNKLDTELRPWKSKASQAFERLKDRVWFNKDLTIKTKCAVCSAIVLSTLLYRAESWAVYMAQAHSLNAYMMRHLRQILGVKWWHRIPNQGILMTMLACTKHLYIATSAGQVISSGSTTFGCQSKSFIPSSRKDIEVLAGQNSVSKIPSKEA